MMINFKFFSDTGGSVGIASIAESSAELSYLIASTTVSSS
jgi:hypothetical protein